MNEEVATRDVGFVVSNFVVPLLVIILLGLAVWRFWPRGASAVPGSGRWVAGLRMLADLSLGAYLAALILVVAGHALSHDSTSFSAGGERLQIDRDGIEMAFRNGETDLVGKPVPPEELERRANTAGAGYDLDDDLLGRARERFGADAVLYADQRVVIRSSDPGATAWAAAVLTLAIGAGTILLGFWALRALLVLAGRGEPFHPRAVFWLRVMAAAVVVNVVGVAFGSSLVGHLLTSSGGGTENVPYSMDATWLLAAAVLLALAEIWRHGVALQREAEATV